VREQCRGRPDRLRRPGDGVDPPELLVFFSKIPALELPTPFTVLDEFSIVNDADKNWTNARLLEKQGQIKDFSTMGLSKLQQIELMKLLLARKEDLDNVTVEEWFSEGFLNSNFYMFWRTIFSFQNWHSALDMKLYAHGLRYLMDGLSDMTSRVFPKYNQCDSFIRPLMTCWKGQGSTSNTKPSSPTWSWMSAARQKPPPLSGATPVVVIIRLNSARGIWSLSSPAPLSRTPPTHGKR